MGRKVSASDDFTPYPTAARIVNRPLMATALVISWSCGLRAACFLARSRVFGRKPRKDVWRGKSDAEHICVPRAAWTITAAGQHQAVDYTPYEGMDVTGRAAWVFINGELAVRDGEPVGSKPGRYVAR